MSLNNYLQSKLVQNQGCNHGGLSIVSGGMTQCFIPPLTTDNPP